MSIIELDDDLSDVLEYADDDLAEGDTEFEADGNGGDDDISFGGSVDATLHGGLGGDHLSITGTGMGFLFGDDGDDELDGGINDDDLDGGVGNDDLDGGDGDDALDGGDGDDIITGGNGNDTEAGGNGIDHLSGGGGDDDLRGGGDNDVLAGGDGVDDLFGGAGSDYENGGLGNDNVDGNAGNDHLNGSSGNDSVDGGAGNDDLLGGTGTDVLIGGTGQDDMWGGSAGDDFDFNAIAEMGKSAATRDVIHDFVHGLDDIDLRTLDANTRASGNNAFHFIGGAAFSHHAGELHAKRVNLSGTANDVTLIEGDVNGDGAADFQIELSGLLTVNSADFLL